MSFLLSKEEEKLWNQIDECELDGDDDLDSPENLQRMKANEEAIIEFYLQGKKYATESLKDAPTQSVQPTPPNNIGVTDVQPICGHGLPPTNFNNSLYSLGEHIHNVGIRKFAVELMNCLEGLEERDRFSFIQNIKIFIDNEQRNSKNK